MDCTKPPAPQKWETAASDPDMTFTHRFKRHACYYMYLRNYTHPKSAEKGYKDTERNLTTLQCTAEGSKYEPWANIGSWLNLDP